MAGITSGPIVREELPSEQQSLEVACASAILKQRFAGVISLGQAVTEHEAAEVGGNWILDVYFVPSSRLIEFEDFAADLSVYLFNQVGIRVLVVSHTEEATKEHYMETLLGLSPYELENRNLGQAATIGPGTVAPCPPWSWQSADCVSAAGMWEMVQEQAEWASRKAA